MRNLNIKLFIISLVLVGAGLTYAKVTYLGLPLTPDKDSFVWAIEAKIEFTGYGGPVVVNFDIPDKVRNFLRIDEFFISRDFGLNIEKNNNNRRVEWSARRVSGTEQLYYHIEILPQSSIDTLIPEKSLSPVPPVKPDYEEPLASAIEDVLTDVRAKSADIFTFVSQLLIKANSPNPEENIEIIRRGIPFNDVKWTMRLISVLAGARIPARLVQGIELKDGLIDMELTPWLEVHNGKVWQGFNPLTGEKGYPENFFRWSVGESPLFRIDNAKNGDVKFSIGKRPLELTDISSKRGESSDSLISALTLTRLPLGAQNVFRILLMIPIGALVVVITRTLIGIPTFGTFMPILIALAFRETELAWGIGLFCFIVTAGLLFRFYLERLHLLLVPRLSAVLVLVILLMLGISLLSSEFNLTRGFSIALFPIIILTMVIERMSIVWEESGPGQALKESAGSLLVAIGGYLVMNQEHLQHLVFIFPELLLVVLAIFIMIGRYNGYRLTELWRFRDLIFEKNRKKNA